MMKKSIFLILLALFSGSVFAQSAPTQGVLDSMLAHFVNASTGQMAIAQGFAKKIFLSLAAFDMALFAGKKLLTSGDLSDWFGGITLKVFTYGFFWTLIQMAPTWIPTITGSFAAMGTAIGGGATAITPSGVMGLGGVAAQAIWTAWDPSANPLSWGSDLIMSIVVVGSMLFTMIAFMLVALQLLMTQIEFALISGVGLVQLGMSGASFTTMFSEKYFGYIVSTGIKMMMIFVIAGFGTQISQGEIDLIASYQSSGNHIPPVNLLMSSIVVLMYGAMAMQIPSVAGALMNGSPSMSAGGMAGGAAAIAGGVAGAAMAGAGAAAGLYGAGKSGLEAGKSALDKLTALTSLGGDSVSSAGDNFDRLASLTGANGGGDSIGSPGSSNFNASNEASKPSTFKDGLNKAGDGLSKMASQEGGGGSGISIRFNHLGD
jgi:type IV secretion system protein TrbL